MSSEKIDQVLTPPSTSGIQMFLVHNNYVLGQQVGPKNQTDNFPLWKRTLDLLLILVIPPFFLLVSAFVILIIKCGSKGPVLFRQERMGYKGRVFTCYKFRTMKMNAETKTHRDHVHQLIGNEIPMTKLDAQNDSRLIPLGNILRTTGADELPQLINVLRGEMSIVGPRPCIPYEYKLYNAWHRQRHNVRPGLTGLWQVSGKNNTTFNQMIQLDIKYSECFNLWLDIKIILKTLFIIMDQCRYSKWSPRFN